MPTALPTVAELVALGRTKIRTRLDPGGTGRVDLATGSDLDTLISVLAAMTGRLRAHAADRQAARDPRTAKGDDLDSIASGPPYRTQRLGAQLASGYVYLERAGGSSTNIPFGSRFTVPASGSAAAVVFTATETVAVTGGTTEIRVPVEAALAGTEANVALDDITEITDPLPDTTWALYTPLFGDTYYPPDSIGGGTLRETDEELADRLLRGEPRPGSLGGVEWGARLVTGIKYADVIAPMDGTIILYAGDASYRLPTDLSIAVQQSMTTWGGGGVPVIVRPYTATDVLIDVTLYMRRSAAQFDAASIRSAAATAIIDYFKARDRADEYFRDRIGAAAGSVTDDCQAVVVNTPASDIKRMVDADYAAVTSMTRYTTDAGKITVTIADPLTM